MYYDPAFHIGYMEIPYTPALYEYTGYTNGYITKVLFNIFLSTKIHSIKNYHFVC